MTLHDELLANSVLYSLLNVALPAAFLALGGGRKLEGIARHVLGIRTDRGCVAFVFGACLVLAYLATLPVRYVRELLMERSYGVSIQETLPWLLDSFVVLVAWLVILVPFAVAAWALVRRFPRHWWLPLSAVYFAYSVAVAAAWPALVDPLVESFSPVKSLELATSIREMAKRAGWPDVDLVVREASRKGTSSNATVHGLFAHPRIVLEDNLLVDLEDSSVVYVAAHELGHFAGRHEWHGLIADGAMTALIFAAFAVLGPALIRKHGARWRITRIDEPAALPLFLVVLAVMTEITNPVLLAVARADERAADRFAAAVMADAELCRETHKALSPAQSDPYPWEQLLYGTHPLSHERLATCDASGGAPAPAQ
jgi:STE24 endopeptidase